MASTAAAAAVTATKDDDHRRANPDHPVYALMIVEAIRSLDEAEGSTEASISEYIKANFSGLPLGHDRLLPYYLNKLINNGEAEFVMGPHGRYLMAQVQDGDPKPHGKEEEEEETTNAAEAQEDGSKKRLDIAEAPVCEETVNADDVDAAKERTTEQTTQTLKIVSTEQKVNDEGTNANLNGDDDDAAAAQKQDCEDVLMKNRNNEDDLVDPLQQQSVLPECQEVKLDEDATVNISPEQPSPSQGETNKGTENDEAVADVDAAADHYDDVTQEPEPENQSSSGDGSNNEVAAAAGPLELPSVSPAREGTNDADDGIEPLKIVAPALHHAAANVDDDGPAKELTMMQSSEDGLINPNNEEDSVRQQNLLPECDRMNPDLNATELVQNIAPVAPSQGETKGAENVEADIANLDKDEEEDNEGVPLSCEGDLVMELKPLPPTVSEPLPKRRGRPPKRRWKRNLTGKSIVSKAHDSEKVVLKKILPQQEHGAQKLVPVRRERPPKRKCTEPTQLVDPSTLVINGNGVEAKVSEENQVNESTPMPKRLGRPLKRNPETIDNSKVVVVHNGDGEPNTSPLGTSGNVKFPLAEEGNDGSKPVIKRRGRPPKRKHDGDVEPLQLVVPSSFSANGNAKLPVSKKATSKKDDASEPIPKRRERPPKTKRDGDAEPLLSADDNAKLVVSGKGKRRKDDGSEPVPKRLGRPPKRKSEPTDSSNDAIAQDGDTKLTKRGRKSKKSSNQESGGVSMDPNDNAEMQEGQKESDPVPKHHGRPPKTDSTSVPKRRGRPPKAKPETQDI